jgi:hypothetical protein
MHPHAHAPTHPHRSCALALALRAGDLWPSENLKAAIKARSFNNELIIIGESRVNPFLQVRDQWFR